MKPNPGGILSGKEVVNRENEINKIWDALENQSVVLTSERRVGKTSVLTKMKENPKNDWIPVKYIVEGKWQPIEFVEGLYETLLKMDILKNKFYKLKKLYANYVGGKEIIKWRLPKIEENWKNLLDSIIEDLTDTNKKVLLMFDELPLMVHNFMQIQNEGPKIGMEFLDTLRAIRNKYESTKKVAFIFCGSVGIHLIIKDLKRNYGYVADPINNMKIITLNGMDEEGAMLLCEKLSENENYEFKDKNKVFGYICQSTDNLPFYIQHVFDYTYGLKKKRVTKKLIDEAISYLVEDPKDVGFFKHYIDRIKIYYDNDIQDIALLILDYACKETDFWEEGDVINLVKTHSKIDDETIRESLELLWSDHYLIRNVEGHKRSYKFKYSLLQNYWKINRG